MKIFVRKKQTFLSHTNVNTEVLLECNLCGKYLPENQTLTHKYIIRQKNKDLINSKLCLSKCKPYSNYNLYAGII